MNGLWLAIPVMLALPLFLSTIFLSVVASRFKPSGARAASSDRDASEPPRSASTV